LVHHSSPFPSESFSDAIYISYEHKITGVKTADPPLETVGGILADDMGLGKTLTVLSTILRTAKMSKSYVEENDEKTSVSISTDIETQKIFSRATLVIVPSSRTQDASKSRQRNKQLI